MGEDGDEQEGALTLDNLPLYAHLMLDRLLGRGVAEQLAAFIEGVGAVLSVDRLHSFSGGELKGIFCGLESIEWDAASLKDDLMVSGSMKRTSRVFRHLVDELAAMAQ